jgi:hypothetical protein
MNSIYGKPELEGRQDKLSCPGIFMTETGELAELIIGWIISSFSDDILKQRTTNIPATKMINLKPFLYTAKG